MNENELDRRIAAGVRAVEAEIPPEVEYGLRRRIAGSEMKTAGPGWGWPQVWAALAAAGLMLAVALIPTLYQPPVPEKKITQIRTEFNLPEKNIKIIWVQREDFRLGGAAGE